MNKHNWNSNIFIDENTFENVVCEMLSIFTLAIMCLKNGVPTPCIFPSLAQEQIIWLF